MQDDKKHGKGKMEYADGRSYIGIWVGDCRTGQGICTYTDGSRYE